MKRGYVASIVFAILAVIVFVSVSNAHTPSASLTCEGGLLVDLQKYRYDADKQGHINHVKVTLDGTVIEDGDFGVDFQLVKDPLDQFTGHTATVDIKAWDDPSGNKGWTKVYHLEIGPCQESPTPSPTPQVTPSPTPSPSVSPRPSDPPSRTPRPTGPPTDTE